MSVFRRRCVPIFRGLSVCSLREPLIIRGSRAARDGRAFFKHAKCLKNEAKQKSRRLLCVSKNCLDGNF
jgi:hypothetical protein